MARTKGSKDYPESTKRQAIQLFMEKEASYAEIAQTLGVARPKTIQGWVTNYRREGAAFFNRPRGRPRQARDPAAYIRPLEMKLDLLKKFPAELRRKSPGRSNTG